MGKARKKYVGSAKSAAPRKRKRRADEEILCGVCDCPLTGTKEDTFYIPIAKTPICFSCSDLTTAAIRGVTSLFARR